MRVLRIGGVTQGTLLVLLVAPSVEGGDYAILVCSLFSAGVCRIQHVPSAYEQVSGGGVARPLLTAHRIARLCVSCGVCYELVRLHHH